MRPAVRSPRDVSEHSLTCLGGKVSSGEKDLPFDHAFRAFGVQISLENCHAKHREEDPRAHREH